MTREKQIYVVTVGGVDMIGTLEGSIGDEILRLHRPCSVQRQMVNGKPGIVLFDMLRNGVMAGEFIELNGIAIWWIGRPTRELSSAYQGARAGIIVPAEAVSAAPVATQ